MLERGCGQKTYIQVPVKINAAFPLAGSTDPTTLRSPLRATLLPLLPLSCASGGGGEREGPLQSSTQRLHFTLSRHKHQDVTSFERAVDLAGFAERFVEVVARRALVEVYGHRILPGLNLWCGWGGGRG